MGSHWSVNKKAVSIIENEVIPDAEALNISIIRLKNKATVLDMGIRCKGGFRAGKYFAEIGMGGLGKLNYRMLPLKHYLVPGLQCLTEDPLVCEMGSYVAATVVKWSKGVNGVQVVSGPVRSIRGSDKFAAAVNYRDSDAEKAVAGVQTTEMPDEELAERISEACGIGTENLYIMAARTGCMTGAVQVCARNVEQTMPTLCDHNFPLETIMEANATTPLISIVDDEMTATGRVNDCLIYGQETNILTDIGDDSKITSTLDDLTFDKEKNASIYGVPFQELFEKCGGQWANVPRDWDAPNRISFYSLRTGKVYHTGTTGYQTLEESFIGEGGRIDE